MRSNLATVPTVRADRRPMTDSEARVYRALRIAADYGERCPTNAELAERLGYMPHREGSKPGSCSEIVSALEDAGYIRVWRFAKMRIVEICATGRRTATVSQVRPHWRLVALGTATYSGLGRAMVEAVMNAAKGGRR